MYSDKPEKSINDSEQEHEPINDIESNPNNNDDNNNDDNDDNNDNNNESGSGSGVNKKKKKKTKETKGDVVESKRKPPAHIALLKKKMEEEAEMKRKLQEEEEERQRKIQIEQAELLKVQAVQKEKKKEQNAKEKARRKESAVNSARIEALKRLGLDPDKIKTGKSVPIVTSSIKNTSDHDMNDSTDLDKSSQNNSKTMLRAPICCILGGVDSGKTTLIDNIKNTNVQTHEAGGITQKISAIWVDKVDKEEKEDDKYDITGLLILDTPGHDSFHSLRHLGASICNIVFLMIDITADVRPQTIKAIELIKEKKIPFVIVLNKIDRLYDWVPHPNLNFSDNLNSQSKAARDHFHTRLSQIQIQLNSQSLNVILHYLNKDPKHYVSMVPVSSKTGESVKELLTFITRLSTRHIHQNLVFDKNKISGIVLSTEVIKGFGKCVNIILSNGNIKPDDTLILESINGAIEVPILKLINSIGSKQYKVHKEANGTTNVIVVLKTDIDLNNLIIGSHFHHIPETNTNTNTNKSEFIQNITEKIKEDMKSLERNVNTYGISLHSSTYGAIEALIDYLEEKNYPYFRTKIGKIKKTDLVMCENTNNLIKDNHYNILVAFDTSFDFDVKHVSTNTVILTGNIIFRLFEGIEDHVKRSKEALLEQQKEKTIFPAKFQLIDEQHIFANRNPMLLGVRVLAGKLRIGTPIMVMKDNTPMRIGTVRGLKDKHDKVVYEVCAGDKVEVPVRIEPDQGYIIKQIKKDFDMDSMMYSHLDENSSNNLRKYFWDSMSEKEHELTSELETLLDL